MKMPRPKKSAAQKAPSIVPEEAPVYPDIPSGGTRWQGWYTPLWHAAIDCGIHDSRQAAQSAVIDTIREFVRGVFYQPGDKVSVDVQWTDDDVSLAYGDDGSPQSTTLPLARVEAVRS